MKIKLPLIILTYLISFNGFSQSTEKIKGSKNVITQITEIEPFNRLVIGDNFNINIKQGQTPSIQIETDDNLHDVIAFKVLDGSLSFKTTKKITSSKKMEITVIYKNSLSIIELNGDAVLTGTNTIKVKDLIVRAKESSEIHLTIEAETLLYIGAGKTEAELNTTSKSISLVLSDNTSIKAKINAETTEIDMLQRANAKLEGTSSELNIKLDNSSVLKAEKLITETCNLITNGRADAHIEVTENLVIEASGTSETYIYGNPKFELKQFEDEAILRKE